MKEAPSQTQRGFTCPVEGCPGTHEESYHMCSRFLPPLWEPMGRYTPGDRVVFANRVWVKLPEKGLWQRA